MKYKQILDELYSLESKKFERTLINMRSLAKMLGNPEKKLNCIHVSGTNGKGSVCAIISSILIDAGYKVGMYTSPHLKRFNERVRVNNRLISNKDIVDYYLRIRKYRTKQTFFEMTTMMAFQYFYDNNVDFAIIEVGLGGRLDSTNIINPLLSIISNIGLEHQKYLGNTIKEVAEEKSGIIKQNIPVITSAEGIALKTIRKIANKNNSKLVIIKSDNIKIKNIKNRWLFDYKQFKNLKLTKLNAKFQIKNAVIAIEAILTLNDIKKLTNNKILKKNKIINKINIKNGLKNTEWPGRFQFLNPNTIIDSAHNETGFKVLFSELKYLKYQKLILVMGFSDDKDIKKISKIIGDKANKIILTKSNNYKAADPSKLIRYFKNSIIIENPEQAMKYSKKIATKKDLVLITGSIFLVGELT